ncbi:unnamed protein product [Prunus armeniaca]|uniref:Uncharacterized protein n=1 Tax=Prunus armeniaca TaxID=36596 RepID=A0A6J5WRL0_PRUAR|nr:unnamed protein product [Prunus armeniaca]
MGLKGRPVALGSKTWSKRRPLLIRPLGLLGGIPRVAPGRGEVAPTTTVGIKGSVVGDVRRRLGGH